MSDREPPTAARVHDADPVRAATTAGLLDGLARGLRAPVDRAAVHTDAEAATATRARGATGLAQAGRILLDPARYDPATPAGRHVLAHEAAHLAQPAVSVPGHRVPALLAGAEAEADRLATAAAAGQPVSAPRSPRPAGIAAADNTGDAPPGRVGERPPDADYTVADGRAPEDGHVLFAQGSADLSAGARARLSQLVAGVSRPVTVDVHGYASNEGDETFNRNLSAHRATATAQALRALLPDGSAVRVFARGQTAEFGQERGPNRRVGVDVHHEPAEAPAGDIPPVEGHPLDVGPGDRASQPQASGTSEPQATGTGTGERRVRLFPPLDPGRLDLSGVESGQPGWLRLDPALPTPGFDVGAVAREFSLHGARLSLGDLDALEAQYGFWYPRLVRHLGPDLTATVLNIGVGNAVGAYLAREHPTATDVVERDIDIQHQLQGAWQTPILTIDVLEVLRDRGVIE